MSLRYAALGVIALTPALAYAMTRSGLMFESTLTIIKLMKKSIKPAELLDQMAAAALAKYATHARWAEAAALPKETLSRLKSRPSCDLRTLAALARAADCALVAVPAGADRQDDAREFSRQQEDRLLDLAASGSTDPAVWRAHGTAFFMGGLAVMLASARGFDRERYLRLAEALHPGVSTPEVFGMWLKRSPVRPSRFLPMARKRKHPA